MTQSNTTDEVLILMNPDDLTRDLPVGFMFTLSRGVNKERIVVSCGNVQDLQCKEGTRGARFHLLLFLIGQSGTEFRIACLLDKR
jgi:hypothetical protein